MVKSYQLNQKQWVTNLLPTSASELGALTGTLMTATQLNSSQEVQAPWYPGLKRPQEATAR